MDKKILQTIHDSDLKVWEHKKIPKEQKLFDGNISNSQNQKEIAYYIKNSMVYCFRTSGAVLVVKKKLMFCKVHEILTNMDVKRGLV